MWQCIAAPIDRVKLKSKLKTIALEKCRENSMRAISLQGFQLAETLVLAEGLVHLTDHPERVLQEILVWTGG